MLAEVFERLLRRAPESHKYDFGHVLVVGGSPGMVGAPLLAGRAAMRVGSGLMTIASSPAVIDKLEHRVEEIMTLVLPAEPAAAVARINEFITERRVNVVVLGPGTGPSEARLLRSLMHLELPLIIDGGALGSLQDYLDLLDKNGGQLILTPHLGEFQRFFSKPLPSKPAALIKVAQTFAQQHRLTLVLKGHPTHVIDRQGDVYQNTTGGPELATAGTGDVLAGIIGGLVAQLPGLPPAKLAGAAVYLHGLAGTVAAEQQTVPAVIASDIINALPTAFRSLSAG